MKSNTLVSALALSIAIQTANAGISDNESTGSKTRSASPASTEILSDDSDSDKCIEGTISVDFIGDFLLRGRYDTWEFQEPSDLKPQAQECRNVLISISQKISSRIAHKNKIVDLLIGNNYAAISEFITGFRNQLVSQEEQTHLDKEKLNLVKRFRREISTYEALYNACLEAKNPSIPAGILCMLVLRWLEKCKYESINFPVSTLTGKREKPKPKTHRISRDDNHEESHLAEFTNSLYNLSNILFNGDTARKTINEFCVRNMAQYGEYSLEGYSTTKMGKKVEDVLTYLKTIVSERAFTDELSREIGGLAERTLESIKQARNFSDTHYSGTLSKQERFATLDASPVLWQLYQMTIKTEQIKSAIKKHAQLEKEKAAAEAIKKAQPALSSPQPSPKKEKSPPLTPEKQRAINKAIKEEKRLAREEAEREAAEEARQQEELALQRQAEKKHSEVVKMVGILVEDLFNESMVQSYTREQTREKARQEQEIADEAKKVKEAQEREGGRLAAKKEKSKNKRRKQRVRPTSITLPNKTLDTQKTGSGSAGSSLSKNTIHPPKATPSTSTAGTLAPHNFSDKKISTLEPLVGIETSKHQIPVSIAKPIEENDPSAFSVPTTQATSGKTYSELLWEEFYPH